MTTSPSLPFPAFSETPERAPAEQTAVSALPVAVVPQHPALREIETLIRARYPVIYILSQEEGRVAQWLRELAKRRGKRLFEWSFTTGMVETGTPGRASKSTTTKDPMAALDEAIQHVDPGLYLFKDLHPFLARTNVGVIRRLKEAALALKDSYKTLILLSPHLEVPTELEKDVTVVDFPLPGIAELGQLLDHICDEVKDAPGLKVDLSGEGRELILQASLGLTLAEAENVYAKTLVSDGCITSDDLDTIISEKKQAIRKGGLLEWVDTDLGMKHVGGLDLLKQWLAARREAFTDRAREFGLPPPKGMLLLGVQGCGKSLCAKAVASQWRMPLLRLDIGRLFGSLVGSSEENVRRALAVAAGVAPCVLWLDEIDKALAGTRSSGSTDGGITARVFGTLLTWMNEKKDPVFFVATANDISNLPPELLRKGRFDEIFFVDLPTSLERRQILELHLVGRKRDPKNFDVEQLAACTEGFSGAELEEAIVSGLYEAFAEGSELRTEHIVRAIGSTVPLSKTMERELLELRQWATTRARSANCPEVVITKPLDSGRRRVEMD